MKTPWLAGMLNLIPGLGYLYLGVRTVFAWLLIVSAIFAVSDLFNPKVSQLVEAYPLTILGVGACLLATVAFVIDAYLEAKRLNTEASLRKSKS